MKDLRVVVEEIKGFCDLPVKPGDYFEVRGGRIIVPEGKYICLWALQSMMPLLPLKQRNLCDNNDWVPGTKRICCPDPNGMVIYRIDTIHPKTKKPEDNEKLKPRILVDTAKCTGCRGCEVACSVIHTDSFCPGNSRIRVEKNEAEGLDKPYVCRQCGNAPCVEACPQNALYRDPETKAILVREDKCTGCKLCFEACPFGAIFFHKDSGKALICDLCGGKPACTDRCPVNAITFGNAGSSL